MSDLFTATMAIFLTLALYPLFKGVDEGRDRFRRAVRLPKIAENYEG